MLEPVHGGKNFLDLVSDDVPAGLIRHSVDPFAMRLVGHANSGNAGPRVLAIDQHRDQNLAAVFSETPRRTAMTGLRPRRDPRAFQETNPHPGSRQFARAARHRAAVEALPHPRR